MKGAAVWAVLVGCLATLVAKPASGEVVAEGFDGVEVLRRALEKLEESEEGEDARRDLRRRRKRQAVLPAGYQTPLPVKKCPKPLEPGGDPGSAGTEDRYCEKSFKPAATCGCTEVCHIWGDPHVSPFFSGCSEVSMGRVGRYTLYKLPTTTERTGIHIEGVVNKFGKWKFMDQLYVNDEAVMTIADCKSDPNFVKMDLIPLVADSGHEVLLKYRANCNFRHSVHLNVTIELRDGIDGADTDDVGDLLAQARASQPVRPGDQNQVPDSTTFFDDDSGLCVDPLKYNRPNANGAPNDKVNYGKNPFWLAGEKCIRPSGLSDGLACSCNTQCAAYGDPHVYDFYRKQARGNDFRATVNAAEQRVFYSLNPYYSAVVGVDNCDYITTFWGVYLKDSVDLTDPSVDLNDPDNYLIAKYTADEVCQDDADVVDGTRKKIRAPESAVKAVDDVSAINMQVYDQSVDGFNVGKFVKFTDGSISAVPRAQQSQVGDFIVSSGKTAESVIYSGGVTAILKCHITKAKGKEPPRKYFNLCIERNGVDVETPTDDARRRTAATRDDAGILSLKTLESTLRSHGWCSLGRELKRGNFENRAAGQFDLFPVNPEAQS